MNKDIAEIWARALESGDYDQTRGQLRRDESYCCLGVLCDLHEKLTGDGGWALDYGYAFYVDQIGRSSGSLPPAVASWAGLKYSAAPSYGDSPFVRNLIDQNDCGTPFPAIAAKVRNYAERKAKV